MMQSARSIIHHSGFLVLRKMACHTQKREDVCDCGVICIFCDYLSSFPLIVTSLPLYYGYESCPC